MDEWIKISQFLFNGIYRDIAYYLEFPDMLTEDKFQNLAESVTIYNIRCIASGKCLTEKLNKLRDFII